MSFWVKIYADTAHTADICDPAYPVCANVIKMFSFSEHF